MTYPSPACHVAQATPPTMLNGTNRAVRMPAIPAALVVAVRPSGTNRAATMAIALVEPRR